MRTLLYLAHDFPPAGGSASNRASAFCRYLPDCGWAPTVVTTEADWAVNRDDSVLADLRPGTRVVRTRSWEPRATPSWPSASNTGTASAPRRVSALRRHLGHVRRFPDGQRGWIPFAVRAALRVTRQSPVHALYTTAGPFSSHLAGLVLKRRTGVPWIAELRDGWYLWNRAVFPDYPAWRGVLEQALEARVVRSCDRLVLVTETMADAYRQQYPDLPLEHFAVVSNGFDRAQMPSDLSDATREGGRFDVLHAGALYHGRSVVPFLQAVARVTGEDARLRSDFRLTLLGTMDGAARAALVDESERLGVADLVEDLGYQSHAATLRRMQGAALLLLVGNSTAGAEGAVPGKLFEYLAARRPVLALTLPGAEGARIVRETASGYVARLDDAQDIARVLRTAYAMRHVPFCPREAAVNQYDRAQLSGRLARLLDEVVESRTCA